MPHVSGQFASMCLFAAPDVTATIKASGRSRRGHPGLTSHSPSSAQIAHAVAFLSAQEVSLQTSSPQLFGHVLIAKPGVVYGGHS